MTKQPLNIPPGIRPNATGKSEEGRYVDADKIRFPDEFPEKIGGYADYMDGASFVGKARAIMPYRSLVGSLWIGIGTHLRLYAIEGDDAFNVITPVRASGSLSNAFDTVTGSALVTVTHSSHGLKSGAYATFSSGTAIGSSGITLDGEYPVIVLDPDTYTVQHGSAAASDETSQGSADYAYDINPGEEITTQAFGFGVGPFGAEAFGTARTLSALELSARTWSLDVVAGEDLLACPRNGSIYVFDTSAGTTTRAVVLSNAPTDNQAAFVTEQGAVVALGANGNPMDLAFSDDTDRTVWTPAADNSAGLRTLKGGSKLMAGTRLRDLIHTVWSDAQAFRMIYTGDDVVYSIRAVGTSTGIIGPKAYATFGGVAYWLSPSGFWQLEAFPQLMPNALDIRDYVLKNINKSQYDLVHAGINEQFQEIWFFYPSTNSSEVDRYVMFSLTTNEWTIGTFAITAWADNEAYAFPLATTSAGKLNYHETGVDADGAAMPWHLEMADADVAEGDSIMDLERYIPDFQRRTGDITITVQSKDRPGETPSTNTYVLEDDQYEKDMRESGRLISLKWNGSDIGSDVRFGKHMIDIQPGGDRD